MKRMVKVWCCERTRESDSAGATLGKISGALGPVAWAVSLSRSPDWPIQERVAVPAPPSRRPIRRRQELPPGPVWCEIYRSLLASRPKNTTIEEVEYERG